VLSLYLIDEYGGCVTAPEDLRTLMETDPLALDAQVCFAMVAGARSIVSLYRPVLAELGLTHPQYLVMLALWEDDRRGTSTTVGALAGRLRLDAGTLSPLLRRLEQAELLAKSRDDDDARVVHVSLTTTGRALRERARSVPGEVRAASGLSLEQLMAVHTAATAVIDAAARHEGERGEGVR